MLFISTPQCLRVPFSHCHHAVICHANSRTSTRKSKPGDRGDRDPLPPRPDRRQHSRSPRRTINDKQVSKHVTSNHSSSSSSHPSNTESSDIWITRIDDHTRPETLIHQSPPSPTESIKVETKARMAARSSKDPKPKQIPSEKTNNNPKKKRGRPKGSKSIDRTSMPQPQISPFIMAVREDMRRRSIAANRDIMSGLFDFQPDEPVNWDDVQLSAPNGLPNGDDNADLLQELLPIIAQQENEERRVIGEEEERLKQLVSTCYTQFNSIHRFSDRLDNLKPYQSQQESEEECQACSGTGMTVCEYCKGEGFVDLGENGEKFNPKFGNNVFTMPKHVTGNIYHCPLCGGLQKERCISCFGTGTISDGGNIFEGRSKQGKQERAWKVFDMNELIEQEGDRIEIGVDGTIIMRAKRRGRRKKGSGKAKKPMLQTRRARSTKSVAKKDTSLSNWDEDGAEPATVVDYDADLTSDIQGFAGDSFKSLPINGDECVIPSAPTVGIPPGRPVGRTTDFVNTTDYQVGRRLQRQAPNIGQDFQDPSNSSVDSSLPQNDQDGAEDGEEQLM